MTNCHLYAATCGSHTFEISTREGGPKYQSAWLGFESGATCFILSKSQQCNTTRCPPGTYSHPGSTICTECAQGSFNSDPSATACEMCPEWSGGNEQSKSRLTVELRQALTRTLMNAGQTSQRAARMGRARATQAPWALADLPPVLCVKQVRVCLLLFCP